MKRRKKKGREEKEGWRKRGSRGIKWGGVGRREEEKEEEMASSRSCRQPQKAKSSIPVTQSKGQKAA